MDFRIAFDTLRDLRRGRRVGKAQAFFASALKVNPILAIRDGITEGIARGRTRTSAIGYLCNCVPSFPEPEKVAIEDAATPDENCATFTAAFPRFPKERIY